MTDSGVFSLLLLLYWMSNFGPLSQLTVLHPDGYRGQVFLPVTASEDTITKTVEEYLRKTFTNDVRTITVDGVRFEVHKQGKLVTWFATRKSGYEAIQKYFYGSSDETIFRTLEKLVQP